MTHHISVTCGASNTNYPGFTNVAIQSAINYVASLGGGEVVLSKGTFALADSVHMKSDVTLRGQGSETILLKDDMIKDEALHYTGYGHCEIMVAHPEKFSIGMGVYITDDRANGGFLATQSHILSINPEEKLLQLADPLNCDIGEGRNGIIRTLFPLIKGWFEKRFAVKDLVLDGNMKQNECIDGCRGGAVFFLGCSYASLSGLECRNYDADGISYQQCYDISTDNCNVHHCANNGLHPGSGTIKSSITNCHIHHNGQDGVFYCLRTQYLLLKNCLIEDNHRFGITVGHHDHLTDIIGNTIRNNGWEGIFFRTDLIPYGSGNYSVIKDNLLENNGYTQDELRTCEIHLMNSVDGLRVYNNTIKNPGKIPMIIEVPLKDSFIYNNNFTPSIADKTADADQWYSSKAPEKERFISDFPITEDTLAHLRHICR